MLQINEIFAFHTFPKEREGRGKISILPKATILTNWSQLMEFHNQFPRIFRFDETIRRAIYPTISRSVTTLPREREKEKEK